jgi:hypothetical protein
MKKVGVDVITGGEGENNSPFIQFPFGDAFFRQFTAHFPPEMMAIAHNLFAVMVSPKFPEKEQKVFCSAMEQFFKECKNNAQILHELNNYHKVGVETAKLGQTFINN